MDAPVPVPPRVEVSGMRCATTTGDRIHRPRPGWQQHMGGTIRATNAHSTARTACTPAPSLIAQRLYAILLVADVCIYFRQPNFDQSVWEGSPALLASTNPVASW